MLISADLDSIRLRLEGDKLSLNVAESKGIILGSAVRLQSLGCNDNTVSPDF